MVAAAVVVVIVVGGGGNGMLELFSSVSANAFRLRMRSVSGEL
jgi:hypothetical protein